MYNPHESIQLAKVSFGLAFLAMAEGTSPTGGYIYSTRQTWRRRGGCRTHRGMRVSLDGLREGSTNKHGLIRSSSMSSRAFAQNRRVSAHLRLILWRQECYSYALSSGRNAKQTDDVEFLIGVETEVIFLKSVDPPEGVNKYGWLESAAILAGSAEAQALDEIANALEEAAAPGQVSLLILCFLFHQVIWHRTLVWDCNGASSSTSGVRRSRNNARDYHELCSETWHACDARTTRIRS